MGTVVGLTFLFGFGNVLTLALRHAPTARRVRDRPAGRAAVF